ncbi:hypothetical protein [Paenibacillus marchantiophytorum]
MPPINNGSLHTVILMSDGTVTTIGDNSGNGVLGGG